MEKKPYELPEFETVKIKEEDIVTASPGGNHAGDPVCLVDLYAGSALLYNQRVGAIWFLNERNRVAPIRLSFSTLLKMWSANNT